MFETIEDTASHQAAEVAQHVQDIFSTAKTLKNSMDDLVKQEQQRRVGTKQEGVPFHPAISISGYREKSDEYSRNMESLNVDGVELAELYLPAIQTQRTEVKSRLEWINQQQANLRTMRDELVLQETALNQQSGDYAILLAQGDIAAADVLEQERLNQLQAIRTEKQETEHKLAAVDQAEVILKAELGIYRQMFIKAHRNLLMQKYSHVLLPAFHSQLAELAETLTEMNSTIGKMDNKKPSEWEHWVALAELLDKTGFNFIQNERLKEQRFYESIG